MMDESAWTNQLVCILAVPLMVIGFSIGFFCGAWLVRVLLKREEAA